MRFLLSFGKEFTGLRRTGKLLVVVAVLLLFGMTSPLLAKFTPELLKVVPGAEQFSQLVPTPTVADAVGQYVKNITQFGVLLALVLTMGAVASEKEKGTAALMMTKPLPRASFIVAKFTALALIFTLALALAGLGAWYYTRLLFGVLAPGAFIVLNTLLLLYILVYVAAVLFFSTLSRSQALAAGLGFCLIILLSILGAVPAWRNALPDALIGWGAAYTLGAAGSIPWGALVFCLLLIAASLAGAWLVFRKQEL